MKRRVALAPLVPLVVLLGGGCTHQSARPTPSSTAQLSTPTTDLRPISDSPPYWCEFVPQDALSKITGMSAGLTESRDGWLPDKGLCVVRDGSQSGPMGLDWENSNGRVQVDSQAKKHPGYKQTLLPTDLGYGFVVYFPKYVDYRPYSVISTFQCGSLQPWLGIDLILVSPGRDYVRDLTDLMRIAQKRFGVLHKCTPGPVPPKER